MERLMSDSNKQKQEFYLSVKEMAEKLRTLADELEVGVVTINDEKCSIPSATQVKVGLKAKDDIFSFKLKLKLENALSGKREAEVENYKDLKKRMSKDFKAIKKSCLQEHVVPESALVERFYLDSKKMCTYTNKGEGFYETFLNQTGLFYEAFKTSDLKAMNSAIESLAQIRRDCHDKHK